VKRLCITIIALLGLILAGCGGNTGGTAPININEDAAGNIVLQYLQAKIDGKADTLRSLLCASQEANLDREAASFSGVKAHLDKAVCKKDPNANTVTCSGAIVAEYNGENTNFPLTKYNVTQEDGQWKWCGEAG
jgi:hypothetical protein